MKNFEELINKLKRANDNKEPVLVESGATGLSESHMVYIDFVGERWAKGHHIVYNEDGDEIAVPDTIAYASVINDKRYFNTHLVFKEDTKYAL